MVRIVSDTSTMYTTKQAQEAGFDVSPLSVTIAGKSYREYDEIMPDRFVEIIAEGHLPTSSQPAVGEVVSMYEKYPDDEIINITMALGLSGTYTGAVAAAGLVDHSDNITVLNSRTLCGPHRYLVEKAVQMAKEGLSKDEIVRRTEELMESAKSYLLPADVGYLRRGGRLSPMVSYVGQAVNLAPVMTQTEDSQQLMIAGVRRGFVSAVKFVVKALHTREVGKGWRIYVCHGAAPEKAEQALNILKAEFPEAHFESYVLTPAFITQGGPSCVSIQIIRE